jgi:hypothetical protein
MFGSLLISSTNSRIGAVESCTQRDNQETQELELASIANITMELLQKYTKDDGAIGIDDLDRWPSNSVAVDFLSRTISASSVESLKTVFLAGITSQMTSINDLPPI